MKPEEENVKESSDEKFQLGVWERAKNCHEVQSKFWNDST